MTHSNVRPTGTGHYDAKLDQIQTTLAQVLTLLRPANTNSAKKIPETTAELAMQFEALRAKDPVKEWFRAKWKAGYTKPHQGRTFMAMYRQYQAFTTTRGLASLSFKDWLVRASSLVTEYGGTVSSDRFRNIVRINSTKVRGVVESYRQPGRYYVRINLTLPTGDKLYSLGSYGDYGRAVDVATRGFALRDSLGEDQSSFIELWNESQSILTK